MKENEIYGWGALNYSITVPGCEFNSIHLSVSHNRRATFKREAARGEVCEP